MLLIALTLLRAVEMALAVLPFIADPDAPWQAEQLVVYKA
jgi:hypothetical protein